MFRLFACGYIQYNAFVANDHALSVEISPSAVGYPDFRTVLSFGFELKVFHLSVFFEYFFVKFSIFSARIILRGNVGNTGNEIFRVVVSEHLRKGGVDTDKPTLRSALEKSFDGIFINIPVFFFTFT